MGTRIHPQPGEPFCDRCHLGNDVPCEPEHRAWVDKEGLLLGADPTRMPTDPVTDFITLTNTDLNQLVVSIKLDGTVELGPGITIDEAAKEFYDRVSQYARECGLAKESSAAEHALDAIAKICGCPDWDYPGQLVRDVQDLKNREEKAVKTALEFSEKFVNQEQTIESLEEKLKHLVHDAGPNSCAGFAQRCHDAEKEYRAKLEELKKS